MFQINNGQVRSISLRQIEMFKKRLRIHLENCFPLIIAKLNEEEWQEFLEEGLRRSGNYRLQTENDVTQYFNIMLTLGADFEFSRDYPWAEKILNDVNTPSKKRIEDLNRLVETALKK